MTKDSDTVSPIEVVRSALKSFTKAPLQGDKGAPEVWLEVTPEATLGFAGVYVGDDLIILRGLHKHTVT